jgi:hypothetical protein
MNMKSALFLSRLLSFSSVASGLLVARLLKYLVFGIDGFDRQWNVTPTLWDQFRFICVHCFHPYLAIVVLCIGIDALVGPLFFREEVTELKTIVHG